MPTMGRDVSGKVSITESLRRPKAKSTWLLGGISGDLEGVGRYILSGDDRKCVGRKLWNRRLRNSTNEYLVPSVTTVFT